MNRITTLIISLILGTLVLCTTSYASAQENPADVVKTLVSDLKQAVAKDKVSLQNSPIKLYQTIQKVLVPHVAMDQMAANTLGGMWRSASKVQRQQFVAEFSKMLTKMYAQGLLKVMNYEFKIYPLRGHSWKTASMITVSGQIVPKNGGSPSRVTYYLTHDGKQWKIYDVAVEGISFSKTFHAQFASFKDMKTLLQKMEQLNAKAYKK